MKRKNIIIISLNTRIGREVASQFAKQMKLEFVDCRQRLAEVLAEHMIFEQISTTQIDEIEKDILTQFVNKTNIVIFIDFSIYNKYKALLSDIIYLQLPKSTLDKEDEISRLNFTSRNEKLCKDCKVVELELKDIESVISKMKNF